MFKLYYKQKIWKLKRDLEYYLKITGEYNVHKQKELNYYMRKLNKHNQSVYIYCPLCWNELISSDSFVSDEDVVTYKCTKCLLVSRWDFDSAPVPILIKDKTVKN